MHPQVMGFLGRVKLEYSQYFKSGSGALKVLECGSYNVNGTPRNLFEGNVEYVGIDHREGPCVDEVSLIHEYKGRPDNHFDVVVSTEMLEHDPYWQMSLKRMVDLLDVGGAIMLTMAAPGRGPHGLDESPQIGYYNNLEAEDVIGAIDAVAKFDYVTSEKSIERPDHYFLFAGKQ